MGAKAGEPMHSGERDSASKEVAASVADLERLPGRVVQGGTIYLVSRIATQAFSWLITLYTARLLSPDDYGLIAIVAILIGLADVLTFAGLGRALIHKSDLEAGDASQAFTISAALAVGTYCIVWFAAPAVAQHVSRAVVSTAKYFAPKLLAYSASATKTSNFS